MGIFNFLKKSTPKLQEQTQELTDADGKYLGDLTKTALINNLLKTPHTKRDEAWSNQFLEHVATASFRCSNPQVIEGPDGFPYFQLLMPESGTAFDCFVLDKMTDDFLLEKGLGVVLNPKSSNPDWVFSYGDILSYKLYGDFYTNAGILFSSQTQDEVVKEQENVMIGQPSETILPNYARAILKNYLISSGIETPKMLLMIRGNGENATHDFGFNVSPNNFENEEQYRTIMQNIAWHLPRQYSFVGLNEASFQEHFMPL